MSEYHNIYQQVKPELDQIEALRLAALKKKQAALKIVFIIAALTLLIALITMAMTANPIMSIIVAFAGLASALITYSHYPAKAIKAYEFDFKNKVIRSISKALEPSSTYYPSRGISQSSFKSTGHYRTGIDRYSSEDCFDATIGSTEIRFSEIHAEYKRRSTDSKGRTTTTWHDIFKGVLFIADFHKNFNTWLIIRPDNESVPVFGWISKKLQGMSSSSIRMEDPEFEKGFKVNAGDDQQARYILTPDMQQRLLKLRASYGSKIIISLKDSNIYITAPNRHNLYEPNIKVSSFSQTQVTRIAQEIEYYFRIVKMLNLNTRIWTKD